MAEKPTFGEPDTLRADPPDHVTAAAEHRYHIDAGFRATVEHNVSVALARQDDMRDGADDIRRHATLDAYLTWPGAA